MVQSACITCCIFAFCKAGCKGVVYWQPEITVSPKPVSNTHGWFSVADVGQREHEDWPDGEMVCKMPEDIIGPIG